jgi:hypothetical protein
VYEPRPRFDSRGKRLPNQLPFITWPHQDPAILEIRKNLGLRDIGADKSRGEGVSWFCLGMGIQDWLFEPGAKIGLVSSTEKKADDPGNMDSLLAKMDWELTLLPQWMTGEKDVDWTRSISEHSFVNKRNGAQLNAFAAVGGAGRGGRYTWFFMDELAEWQRGPDERVMASTAHATESRLVVSTPCGNEGAYYNFMHSPSNMVRVTLDWKDNPTRNRGLYRIEKGVAIAVDAVNNPLPASYTPPTQDILDMWSRLRKKGFVLENKVRSPWYDVQCDRADAFPHIIAQELDRDFGGTMFRYYRDTFRAKAEETVRPPIGKGIITYHPETYKPEFEEDQHGQLSLWCTLDPKSKTPADHQYIIGIDISSGLGGMYTSNSVAQVIDLNTMEQVAEYATNTVTPSEFADDCMALGKFFNDAELAWEANFGGDFTKRVLDRKYPLIYRRKVIWRRAAGKTLSEPGWWTDERTKVALLSELDRKVKSGELTIRSAELLEETGQYVYLGGKVEHMASSAATATPDAKGKAHGDRVMAIGVALMASKERHFVGKDLAERDLTKNPPPGTMEWRDREFARAAEDENDIWDHRTMADLAMGKRF